MHSALKSVGIPWRLPKVDDDGVSGRRREERRCGVRSAAAARDCAVLRLRRILEERQVGGIEKRGINAERGDRKEKRHSAEKGERKEKRHSAEGGERKEVRGKGKQRREEHEREEG